MTVPPLATATASARDSLRRAVGGPWDQPAEIGAALANISASIAAIDQVLSGLARQLREPGVAVVSVDGPFRGDTAAAVETAGLWLVRAAAASAGVRTCVDNAHIAVSGLAEHREGSK
ncbi:hypothetical protein M8542_08280 [Amycolatopsis sp. OK19-0408]|uniref:Uncharacterized protein n=1 Tax=Amycolatopsis iheyensis TaxID=2945988 RepID=A0A9X2SHJ9_9PSEU|nr:hypothetical protein [Amycolatopsis iheyensis]MCR6482812.1 hypothetical protein [Amycolatopsis iheyensis]